MGVQIVKPAQKVNLTTLTRVKCEAELNDQDDQLLSELLADASAAIESHCNRVFLRERVAERLSGQDGLYLHLTRRPVVAVHSLSLDGDLITDFEVAEPDAGTLYRQAGWASLLALGWGAHSGSGRVGLAGDIPTAGPRHLRFTANYTAGWLGPESLYKATTLSVNATLPGFEDSAGQLPEVFPGDIITTSGFANSNNNGRFLVVSATSSAVTVEGPFLVAEAAGEKVTIDPRNLPRDVERAAILAVKAYFKARYRDPQVTDSVLGPLTSRFVNDEKALPPAAVGLLARYKI